MACKEKLLIKHLRAGLPCHWFVRKLHGSSFQRDLPDLLISGVGRAWAIEIKTARGTLTPGQRRGLQVIEGAGGALMPAMMRIRCDHGTRSTRAQHSVMIFDPNERPIEDWWTSILNIHNALIDAHDKTWLPLSRLRQ